MNIYMDEIQAKILLRLIRGQKINPQESREIIGVERCLIDELNEKQAGAYSIHRGGCKYSGAVPTSMCPCDCGE